MPQAFPRTTRSTIRNRLLRAMSDQTLDAVWPSLEWVPLTPRASLLLPNEPIKHVVFVEVGSVSMIATLENGEEIEVGLVGAEGLIGLPVLLGTPTSSLEALVQAEGGALRMPTGTFRQALAEHPAMIAPMLRYIDAFLFQVSQTAACNGHHQIEQRLARWILMTHDRVDGDRFTMTQQFLSYMLGVQRPSVTLAVRTLQRAGLIRHQKGEMEVVDRPGLEAVACECYELVRSRFSELAE